MLLPPLCSQEDYVRLATGAGLTIFAKPFDISSKVSKTWYVITSNLLQTVLIVNPGTSRGHLSSRRHYGHLL